MRRIFDLYLAAGTYVGSRRAGSRGRPLPKGMGLWSHYTIRKPAQPRLHRPDPRRRGAIRGAPEPIVDRETWEKTVALLEAKARTYKRGRPSAGKHLFRKAFEMRDMWGGHEPVTYRDRPHPTDQIYRCTDEAPLPHLRHERRLPLRCRHAVYAYFRDLGGDAESTRSSWWARGNWPWPSKTSPWGRRGRDGGRQGASGARQARLRL